MLNLIINECQINFKSTSVSVSTLKRWLHIGTNLIAYIYAWYRHSLVHVMSNEIHVYTRTCTKNKQQRRLLALKKIQTRKKNVKTAWMFEWIENSMKENTCARLIQHSLANTNIMVYVWCWCICMVVTGFTRLLCMFEYPFSVNLQWNTEHTH